MTAKLCLELRPFHVQAGTAILREGHVGREVYVVVDGDVMTSQVRAAQRLVRSDRALE